MSRQLDKIPPNAIINFSATDSLLCQVIFQQRGHIFPKHVENSVLDRKDFFVFCVLWAEDIEINHCVKEWSIFWRTPIFVGRKNLVCTKAQGIKWFSTWLVWKLKRNENLIVGTQKWYWRVIFEDLCAPIILGKTEYLFSITKRM